MAASSPRAGYLPAVEMKVSSSLIERWLPSLGLAAALTAFLLSPATATALSPWPFLIAAVVLGLPHGAADGAVLLSDLRWPARWRRIAGYVAIMAVAAAALWSFPAAAVLAFLVLSWWHFGAADGQDLSNHRSPAWLRRTWGFGRGGLAISVPFAGDPAAAWAPFSRLAELLGARAPLETAWMGQLGTFGAAASLIALALCATAPAAAGVRAFEWVESGLILLVGLSTDPLFAVGCYFLMVHGFRQSAALGGELMKHREAPLLRRLAVLHRAALILLIPSWSALILLVVLIEPAGARDLAILSLVLYIVATPPHHLFHEVLKPHRPTPGA